MEATTDTATAAGGEREITLRDGTRVTVRPIRPDDAAELRAGFDRLSPESRYRRFLSSTPRLSASYVRYLTDVDHHDHEALVATLPDGEGLGVARFVRSPDDPHVAEVAVTVVDRWQGLGLGTALLELLTDRARAEGIRRFTATMLATNREMRELLEELGPVRELGRWAGAVEVEITLPSSGTGSRLRELLRASASDRVQARLGRVLAGARDRAESAAAVRPRARRQ
jgi:RimJ/RimL family protein N-acetyltransferase